MIKIRESDPAKYSVNWWFVFGKFFASSNQIFVKDWFKTPNNFLWILTERFVISLERNRALLDFPRSIYQLFYNFPLFDLITFVIYKLVFEVAGLRHIGLVGKCKLILPNIESYSERLEVLAISNLCAFSAEQYRFLTTLSMFDIHAFHTREAIQQLQTFCQMQRRFCNQKSYCQLQNPFFNFGLNRFPWWELSFANCII